MSFFFFLFSVAAVLDHCLKKNNFQFLQSLQAWGFHTSYVSSLLPAMVGPMPALTEGGDGSISALTLCNHAGWGAYRWSAFTTLVIIPWQGSWVGRLSQAMGIISLPAVFQYFTNSKASELHTGLLLRTKVQKDDCVRSLAQPVLTPLPGLGPLIPLPPSRRPITLSIVGVAVVFLSPARCLTWALTATASAWLLRCLSAP